MLSLKTGYEHAEIGETAELNGICHVMLRGIDRQRILLDSEHLNTVIRRQSK